MGPAVVLARLGLCTLAVRSADGRACASPQDRIVWIRNVSRLVESTGLLIREVILAGRVCGADLLPCHSACHVISRVRAEVCMTSPGGTETEFGDGDATTNVSGDGLEI